MILGPETIGFVIEGLVALLVTWVVKISSDNRKELRKLNGRTIVLEQWREDKVILDDERYEGLERRISNLPCPK
tara:strand:+ start:3332 stop:3553 length:222 start_codon:yes stop_codon:yes gene_type:complete